MKIYNSDELNLYDLVDFPNQNSDYLRRVLKKTRKRITFSAYRKETKKTHIIIEHLGILKYVYWIKLNE